VFVASVVAVAVGVLIAVAVGVDVGVVVDVVVAVGAGVGLGLAVDIPVAAPVRVDMVVGSAVLVAGGGVAVRGTAVYVGHSVLVGFGVVAARGVSVGASVAVGAGSVAVTAVDTAVCVNCWTASGELPQATSTTAKEMVARSWKTRNMIPFSSRCSTLGKSLLPFARWALPAITAHINHKTT